MLRYTVYLLTLVAAIVFVVLCVQVSLYFLFGAGVAVPLALLGTWDIVQTKHSILRNFPILGHIRFLMESIRPEIFQYFVEADTAGRPYDRTLRTVIYERAKGDLDDKPFGTELDVYQTEYEWLNHSIAPRPKATEPFRVTIGNDQCAHPYNASVLNISAMSFGALSAHALLAMNKGAKMGNFYHDTGEGGVSPYHKRYGGDLVWEIGSGYFGCRDDHGHFNPELFQEQSRDDQVKMVEIKVSQGAKAGHGGVLPGPKVSLEIAQTRNVPAGVECISPAYHTAFSTPIELIEFVQQLRELSGGKPAGFKLAIGRPTEFMSICKAIRETGIYPDFIVIDGAEGGTGAGPIEFLNHLGMPLTDGLVFATNCLRATGIRDKIKVGCSAKIATAFSMASRIGLGADWCNAARAFMFAVGCIQAQRCQTNRCPVGVATQDPKLFRAIDVDSKAERVKRFHEGTLNSLAQVVAAAGLDHCDQFGRHHFMRRVSPTEIQRFIDVYPRFEDGELLDGKSHNKQYNDYWNRAKSTEFENVPTRASRAS